MSKIVKKVLELKENGVKMLELPEEKSYHVYIGKYTERYGYADKYRSECDEFISDKIGVMSSSEYIVDYENIKKIRKELSLIMGIKESIYSENKKGLKLSEIVKELKTRLGWSESGEYRCTFVLIYKYVSLEIEWFY